ncbi:hypothetical protein K438DRAFT_1774440 [Mycena galopus ATCC 62051]|nr:hypothetical protein K438DRAFT_1774440 [Mycena galopus ATCC 62051]
MHAIVSTARSKKEDSPRRPNAPPTETRTALARRKDRRGGRRTLRSLALHAGIDTVLRIRVRVLVPVPALVRVADLELLREPHLLRLLVRDPAPHARDLLLQVVVPQLQLEELLVVFAQARRERGEVDDGEVAGEGRGGAHDEGGQAGVVWGGVVWGDGVVWWVRVIRRAKVRVSVRVGAASRRTMWESRRRGLEECQPLKRFLPSPTTITRTPHPAPRAPRSPTLAHAHAHAHPTMSTFIKFGNHVIAPFGTLPTAIADPASSVPPSPTTSISTYPSTFRPSANATATATDALALARLLQTKITDLERALADRKARRAELRNGVDKLERTLAALKAQDSREGDKLAKVVKRWNKTVGPGQRRNLAFPALDLEYHQHQQQQPGRRSAFELPRDTDTDNTDADVGYGYSFVCPTTQAASAFNGHDERYRDSYTFTGSAWQAPYSSSFAFSSPAPRSPSPAVQLQPHSSAMSPEALHIENPSADDTPTPTPAATKHNEDTGAGPGHRVAFSEIQNAQDTIVVVGGGNGNGRKRKSVDFEGEGSWASKKTRAGEQYASGSGRNGNGTRKSLRRKNSSRSKNY